MKAPTLVTAHLAISGFFVSLFVLAGYHDTDASCKVEAFGIQAFRLSFTLWNLCVTHCLFKSVTSQGLSKAEFRKLHLFYMVGCYVIPVIIALALLGTDVYGATRAWCWVKQKYEGVRWGLFYIPVILSFIGTIVFRVLVVSYLAKTVAVVRQMAMASSGSDQKAEELQAKVVQRLGGFSIIFVFCYSFALLNRLQNAAQPDHPVFALYILQAVIQPLEPFLNSVLFIWVHRSLLSSRGGSSDPLESSQTPTPVSTPSV